MTVEDEIEGLKRYIQKFYFVINDRNSAELGSPQYIYSIPYSSFNDTQGDEVA